MRTNDRAEQRVVVVWSSPTSSEQAKTVTTAVPDTTFTRGSFLGGTIRQLTGLWVLGEPSMSSACSETGLGDLPKGAHRITNEFLSSAS